MHSVGYTRVILPPPLSGSFPAEVKESWFVCGMQVRQLNHLMVTRCTALESKVASLQASLESSNGANRSMLEKAGALAKAQEAFAAKQQAGLESTDVKLRAMRCVTLLTSRKDASQILRELDVDRSGTLSPQELTIGLERMGEKVSAAVLKEVMKLLDTDGDGDVDIKELEHISSDDVKEQMAKSQSQLETRMRRQLQDSADSADVKLRAMRCVQLLTSRSDALQILRELDVDRSGTVSPVELQEGLERMGEIVSGTHAPALLFCTSMCFVRDPE